MSESREGEREREVGRETIDRMATCLYEQATIEVKSVYTSIWEKLRGKREREREWSVKAQGKEHHSG